MTLEDLILTADTRGIARLRPHLPTRFCAEAGTTLHAARARVMVVTGFHIEGRCETDGPPGAVALVRALCALGGETLVVTDGHAAQVMAALIGVSPCSLSSVLDGETATVVDFPRVGAEESASLCHALLDAWRPTCVVAVERCGATADGSYRTMRGEDITSVTARLDSLFGSIVSIGVGDGGNEIGMGELADASLSASVSAWPCRTAVDHPIIASVSNWGAWGLCAALSMEAGRNVLPDEETAAHDLAVVVAQGGIDGITRRAEPTVDGRSVEENIAVLRSLHALVQSPSRP